MSGDDVVDESGRESFPASDAAGTWQGSDDVDAGSDDRIERVVDGETAVLEFRRQGDRLVIEHTEVPEAIAHRGIAGSLVEEAVGIAVAEGRTLVPRCPFASHWLAEHPEQRARVRIGD